MSDQKNSYEITVTRVNGPHTFQFNIWTDEALGGEWCLELTIGDEYIGASLSNGNARYFADAPAAFAYIETMIAEQEMRVVVAAI